MRPKRRRHRCEVSRPSSAIKSITQFSRVLRLRGFAWVIAVLASRRGDAARGTPPRRPPFSRPLLEALSSGASSLGAVVDWSYQVRRIEIILTGNADQREQRIAAGIGQRRPHPVRRRGFADRTDRPIGRDPLPGSMRQ